MKSGKGSVYEGGILEPMLVKCNGMVKPGTVRDQYVIIVIIEDFFPTILQMARIQKYKSVQILDGKRFMPVLMNKDFRDTTRTMVRHVPGKWAPQGGPGNNYKSAIRQGNWKSIYDMQTGKNELYNLQDHIGETNDLIGLYPGKAKQLASMLAQRLRNWKSPMPLIKSTGKLVPVPDEL